jgi:hypothetical protein
MTASIRSALSTRPNRPPSVSSPQISFAPGASGGAMTFAQVVINDGVVTILQQFFSDDAANVSGSASDEDAHKFS